MSIHFARVQHLLSPLSTVPIVDLLSMHHMNQEDVGSLEGGSRPLT
jgi:hypothetical protein